jgi:hypothetical protein
MVRFYSLLQTVVCAVLCLGTLMPYIQYLMFSQALTADLQDKVARLTRERDDERRKVRHIEVRGRVQLSNPVETHSAW